MQKGVESDAFQPVTRILHRKLVAVEALNLGLLVFVTESWRFLVVSLLNSCLFEVQGLKEFLAENQVGFVSDGADLVIDKESFLKVFLCEHFEAIPVEVKDAFASLHHDFLLFLRVRR